MWLFFIFVGIPVIEIALFIQIGGWLGFFPTLLIIIITAALGAYLVRSQAIATFSKLRQNLEALQNPTAPLAAGAMILLAGALLLTPGFFTDFVGFLLLTPWFRGHLLQYLISQFQEKTEKFNSETQESQNRYSKRERAPVIIEGEYHEETHKPRSHHE